MDWRSPRVRLLIVAGLVTLWIAAAAGRLAYLQLICYGDYLNRAERLSYGKHTPHLLSESLGWHSRYLRSGQMRPREES